MVKEPKERRSWEWRCERRSQIWEQSQNGVLVKERSSQSIYCKMKASATKTRNDNGVLNGDPKIWDKAGSPFLQKLETATWTALFK